MPLDSFFKNLKPFLRRGDVLSKTDGAKLMEEFLRLKAALKGIKLDMASKDQEIAALKEKDVQKDNLISELSGGLDALRREFDGFRQGLREVVGEAEDIDNENNPPAGGSMDGLTR